MLSLYASKTFKMSDGKIEAKMKVGQQKISDNLSMQAFVVNYPIKNLLNLEDVTTFTTYCEFQFWPILGGFKFHFYQLP